MNEKIKTEIISTQVIAQQPERYMGWPTIALLEEKELAVVFSGDRDEHICPWGKTQIIRSFNNGNSWTTPKTINNSIIDDRDAGIIKTSKGTVIISWFTSTAFITNDICWMFGKKKAAELRQSWKPYIDSLEKEVCQEESKSWIRRSIDNGSTWGMPIQVPVSSPHGPVCLRDGRILYMGTDFDNNISVSQSVDDGVSWQNIGSIPILKQKRGKFYEPHLVEAANGDIIGMIRHTPDDDENFLQQTVSRDGGKTWSTPVPSNLWGSPPHLLRLISNDLLVVYGCRRPPYGQRAAISKDNGITWSSPVELSDAPNNDHGYSASVQLNDGSIYTVYYEIDKLPEKPCIKATHWRILD